LYAKQPALKGRYNSKVERVKTRGAAFFFRKIGGADDERDVFLAELDGVTATVERAFGCGVEERLYGFLTGAKLLPVPTVCGLIRRSMRGGVGLVGVATALRLRVSSRDGRARSGVIFEGGVGAEESMVSEVSSLAFYVVIRVFCDESQSVPKISWRRFRVRLDRSSKRVRCLVLVLRVSTANRNLPK
jgi:hypothetical protein